MFISYLQSCRNFKKKLGTWELSPSSHWFHAVRSTPTSIIKYVHLCLSYYFFSYYERYNIIILSKLGLSGNEAAVVTNILRHFVKYIQQLFDKAS